MTKPWKSINKHSVNKTVSMEKGLTGYSVIQLGEDGNINVECYRPPFFNANLGSASCIGDHILQLLARELLLIAYRYPIYSCFWLHSSEAATLTVSFQLRANSQLTQLTCFSSYTRWNEWHQPAHSTHFAKKILNYTRWNALHFGVSLSEQHAVGGLTCKCSCSSMGRTFPHLAQPNVSWSRSSPLSLSSGISACCHTLWLTFCHTSLCSIGRGLWCEACSFWQPSHK